MYIVNVGSASNAIPDTSVFLAYVDDGHFKEGSHGSCCAVLSLSAPATLFLASFASFLCPAFIYTFFLSAFHPFVFNFLFARNATFVMFSCFDATKPYHSSVPTRVKKSSSRYMAEPDLAALPGNHERGPRVAEWKAGMCSGSL